ncbi:MAG TPA: hypothetical protein VMO78_15250, partial [Rhizomicrobium sp.]|nr:hypothetical protein [Rhizomicrobium sp.]
MSALEYPDNGIMGSIGTESVSRRGLLAAAPMFAAGGLALMQAPARAAIVRAGTANLPPYG